MSIGTTFKRLKRRFKKKLYHFLLQLNEFDFGRLRPLCYVLIIAAALLAMTRLPTPETDNAASPEATHSASLASSIRSAVSVHDSSSASIVALFLPSDTPPEKYFEALQAETLYSFYLTGSELSYLAEGAVTSVFEETYVYLDGLHYTYHKNRLPFNRVTELSTGTGTEIIRDQLYHVVSTEDIFSLFHYISYRSLGIMQIYPKASDGTLLSDYQQLVLNETGAPYTIGTAAIFSETASAPVSTSTSVVTMQSGFNLIQLLKEPNKITICVCALFITLFILLWYIVPRMKRIRLWFRIYRIRSKKRSTHTLYGLKKRF